MRAFIFEESEARRKLLVQELKSVGLTPHFITADFFNNSKSLMSQSGMEEQAILIGDTSNTRNYVRALRRSGCINPVIALRETKDSAAVAALLNCGADDVVVSPFSGDELLSRVNSIIRRLQGHASESVTIGEVTAYFDGRDPLISGVPLALSKREHDIFHHLALRSGKLISKNSIYDAIYSMRADQPFDKVIDVYICKLRKKIAEAADSGHQYIQTVRGRGYKFIAPPVADTRMKLSEGRRAPETKGAELASA